MMREEARLSVRAVAAELGLSPSTYASKENKFKKSKFDDNFVKSLVPVFSPLGIPQSRILAMAGINLDRNMTSAANDENNLGHDTDTNMANIEELDVRGAAGGGTMEESSAKKIYDWQIPREMLRTATYATPDRLKIITVVGDSMQETFRPYERVMVDTSDTTPSPPGVFVVYDGLGLVVKRVEHVPHSDPPRVRISSDNPRYTPYERSVDEAYIQGRVLGRWQWV